MASADRPASVGKRARGHGNASTFEDRARSVRVRQDNVNDESATVRLHRRGQPEYATNGRHRHEIGEQPDDDEREENA